MNRFLVIVVLLIAGAGVATAGPLPWHYYVNFAPAGGADAILYGTETKSGYNPLTGETTDTQYSILSNLYPGGMTRINFETETGKSDLFHFGHGDWNLQKNPASDVVVATNRFALAYGFTDYQGNSFYGTTTGHISASGVFTSGTGNFWISLDKTEDIALGGKKARIHFGTRLSESQSVITMEVTEVVETPEPATLLLCGIGLAGVLGFRWKKR